MTATTRSRPSSAGSDSALRRLVVCTASGALSGLLIGGIGGRLAMVLLARLAPETAGMTSDDGFVIGQFTLSGTLNLLLAGTLFGILGGVIYFALRRLMIGPRWFQILSISLGASVIVGSVLVHTDGVDFTFLRPAWLAIALFVAIPGLYAVLLTVLCERRLHREADRPQRGPGAVASWVPRLARAALTVVFVVSLVNLVGDIAVLT